MEALCSRHRALGTCAVAYGDAPVHSSGMSVTEPSAAPRRGRDIRRERAQKQAVKYPYIRRKLAPVELLNSEACEIIEANAETILEEIGIEFRRDPESLRMWREAGAD